MSITIPDPWLMLLVFVVFLLTMFFLNVWLFKPLLGFMDEREASIQRDLQSVASNDSDVQEIQKQIQEILANARQEAGRILDDAISQAKEDYDKKISKKQAEMQRKIEDFRKDLVSQKKSLKTELESYMPDFKKALQSKISQI